EGLLPLDDIFVCYHDEDEKCICRKPRPGMLLEAACIWNVSLRESFMVGDRMKDICAGQAAGCWTVFIKSDYEPENDRADAQVWSLGEAAEWITRNAGIKDVRQPANPCES